MTEEQKQAAEDLYEGDEVILFKHRQVRVREITPDQAKEFFKKIADGLNAREQLEEILIMMTGLKLDDLTGFYPSQIIKIHETIKEVGRHFFDLAEMLGLGDLMMNFVNNYLSELKLVSSTLLLPDIKDIASDTTDGDDSPEPSTTPPQDG